MIKKICVVLILISLFSGCTTLEDDTSGDVETLRIGGPRQELSNLLYIASDQGYFDDQNLDVEIVDLSSGVEAMNYLLKKEIDIALTSEFVSVSNIFDYENIRIIGSIAEADVVEFIGRKDKGINDSEDILGKTIGITQKSSAESFFGIYLTLNGYEFDDINLVDMNPANLTEALKAGDVDAIVIWPPHSFNMKQYFGEDVVSFSVQSDQPFYWQVVINNEYIQDDVVYERFFSALINAEQFSEGNPSAAQQVIRDWMEKDEDYVDYYWPKHNYVVGLEQSMLLLMEVEAEFSINHNMTSDTIIPNYLEYIDTDYLSSVDEGRVNIFD